MLPQLKTAHSIRRSLENLRCQLVRDLHDTETCMLSCLNIADPGDILALAAAARSTQFAQQRAEDLLRSHAPRLQALAEEQAKIVDTGDKIEKRMRFLLADTGQSRAEIEQGVLSRREKEVYQVQIAKDKTMIRELTQEMRDLDTELEGMLEESSMEWAALVKEVTDFLGETVGLLITRRT